MSVYRHISAKKATGHRVCLMCELLGVSESGYVGRDKLWARLAKVPTAKPLE